MGNIGPTQQHFDVLPVPALTVEDLGLRPDEPPPRSADPDPEPAPVTPSE